MRHVRGVRGLARGLVATLVLIISIFAVALGADAPAGQMTWAVQNVGAAKHLSRAPP